ncbi:MAG: hypothetical protein ACOC90_04930 [Bacteroidota bacterium]
MKRSIPIGFIFLLFPLLTAAQLYTPGDSLLVQGQFSAWSHYNPGNALPVQLGGRYIPRVNYELRWPERHQLDLEASVNLYGTSSWKDFNEAAYDGKVKPYRAWARYSTRQLELRLGLQKINFGSAGMLRPLMWFDRIDPRDPLQLTDGVWGLLGRYYFLNNANIWLWGLYGNNKIKGWELFKTRQDHPEIGGRVQVPIPSGEAAITYHHRVADSRDSELMTPSLSSIPEHRLGLDARVDYVVGLWMEGAWVRKTKNLGLYTHQEMMNVGIDYTFGIGNGLSATLEHLLAAYDTQAFGLENTTSFSALSLSYPVGMFDNLVAIVYRDWTNDQLYNFVNWQRQYDRITLHLMAYWNPDHYNLPARGGAENLLGGRGIQLMLVFNY